MNNLVINRVEEKRAVSNILKYELREQSNKIIKEKEERWRKRKEIGRNVVHKSTNRRLPSTGRNELCPCGSGEKFKRCCLGKMERREK